MQRFDFTIKDELGIHARPAGLLVKEAKNYTSVIRIQSGEKQAEATKLMALMGMGIKCGQTITIEAEGEDEVAAAKGIQAFLEQNL